MAESLVPELDHRVPQGRGVEKREIVERQLVRFDHRADQRREPGAEGVPESSSAHQGQRIDAGTAQVLQGHRNQPEEVVAMHREGGVAPVAVDVNHARVGKLAHQPRTEQQRAAGAFDPDVGAETFAQPPEQVSQVDGGRLPGLPPHDRLEFVEQRPVGPGEVGKGGAENGRQVAPGEAGAGIADRIEELLVGCVPQHQLRVSPLAAEVRPHPFAAHARAAKQLMHADVAEELRETQHAGVNVQQVRHHRRAATAGAQDEYRSHARWCPEGHHGVDSSVSR